MHMVGHETIGVDGMPVLPPVPAQPFEIRLVVAVTKKSLAPLVATDDDVIEQTGCEDSRTTGYDWRISKNRGAMSRL